MKTIMLYGFLGKRFGRVHRYDVRSPAEAVRAMCVTLSGFRKALIDGGSYKVLIGGKDQIIAEQLQNPISDSETIRISQEISGAARGFGMILGAVMVVAGMVLTYFGFGAIGVPLAQAGVVMFAGSAIAMLFAPKLADGSTADREANRASYTFDGAVNTAAQGNPVPVFYGGPLIIGSQVISAGISLEQINIDDIPMTKIGAMTLIIRSKQ